MSKHEELSTEDKIDLVLKNMVTNNEKINVSQVAKRLNLSHSAIYKLYPDKLLDIQNAEKRQKLKAAAITQGIELEKFRKQLTDLKAEKGISQNLVDSYRSQNEKLWEHIQHVYNMYDEMMAERNGFAERLKYMK
jgi:AcrR family transcriptional regulator